VATWTFQRDDDQIVIERRDLESTPALVITSQGQERTVSFGEDSNLEKFQHDMEHFLLQTGWTFARFEPDRRRVHDRRLFPRLLPDRRRWWTDGLVHTLAQASKTLRR